MSNLFYVMGASGAGKDSLMNFVRSRLKGKRAIVFAHRYITRPPDAKTENHIYLTPYEFHARLKANLFAMNWESHDLEYGIGKEINYWMYQGFTVVVNGSREYLPTAMEKYKKLQPILIDVSPDVLVKRLRERGRETEQEILERLARNAEVAVQDDRIIRILNDGPLQEAGRKFYNAISGVTNAKVASFF